jgi:TRAP-type C4-dicarboxylate transport system substrate-binding protein
MVMNRWRILVVVLVSISVALTTSVTVTMAKEFEWKIAYTPLPGTAYQIYLTDYFPKRIEAASKGRIGIQLLPGVVNVLDVLDAVKSGRVDGSYILSTGYFGGVVPKWDITGLPGLVIMDKEDEAVPRTINGFLFDAIDKEASEKWNCRVATIAWWARSTGFSNKGVTKLEDFKGMKYRAHSVWNARMVEEFGGASVSMPFGDLYTSLERKIVDACTSAIPPIISTGLYERLKYIDAWPFGGSLDIILINSKSLDSLPKDLRSILLKEFREMTKESCALEVKMARDFMNIAKQKGMIYNRIDQSQIDRYNEIAKKVVWSKWLERTGADGQMWLDNVMKLMK